MPDEPAQALPDRRDPPVFVSGGKRLNFDRHDFYGSELTDIFHGTGKDDGCFPSCSWEELCALADLVVKHPAFRLPEPTGYCPPRIEDAAVETDEQEATR